MSKQHEFLEAAASNIGFPYIWGGKGTHLFDPVKGLVVSPFLGNAWGKPPFHVFDCSGLVTWALKQVTGVDKRGAWNAQALKDALPPLQSVSTMGPHLRYYGGGAEHIFHVAIAVARIDGKWLLLEASGGDHTVTTVVIAEQRGAKVRLGFDRRSDFVCASALPV